MLIVKALGRMIVSYVSFPHVRCVDYSSKIAFILVPGAVSCKILNIPIRQTKKNVRSPGCASFEMRTPHPQHPPKPSTGHSIGFGSGGGRHPPRPKPPKIYIYLVRVWYYVSVTTHLVPGIKVYYVVPCVTLCSSFCFL